MIPPPNGHPGGNSKTTTACRAPRRPPPHKEGRANLGARSNHGGITDRPRRPTQTSPIGRPRLNHHIGDCRDSQTGNKQIRSATSPVNDGDWPTCRIGDDSGERRQNHRLIREVARAGNKNTKRNHKKTFQKRGKGAKMPLGKSKLPKRVTLQAENHLKPWVGEEGGFGGRAAERSEGRGSPQIPKLCFGATQCKSPTTPYIHCEATKNMGGFHP